MVHNKIYLWMIGFFLFLVTPASAQTLTATWLDQSTDMIGGGCNSGPDGDVDVHMSLNGLKTNVAIKDIIIHGNNNGTWVYPCGTGGPNGYWQVYTVQSGGTADLRFNFWIAEQNYSVQVDYVDGTFQGAFANVGTIPTPPPGTLGWTSSADNTIRGTDKVIISMSQSATQAKIYVDNIWVAFTPGPIWLWDTTKVANGTHTIREDDVNQNGTVIYSASATVNVAN